MVRKRLVAGKNFIRCLNCDERVPLIDFIEQRLKSDPVARKILAMEETASRELDAQSLEQILIGHMMAICGEANQVFRPVSMFDYGIDGEVEFRGNDGQPSGKKIYMQLKSGNSYLRTRRNDGREVFDVATARLEVILGLIGQLGYGQDISGIHLTKDSAGFQIVDLTTGDWLLGEADLEALGIDNLNRGFHEFDQTKYMRPVLLGNLGQNWQEKLVPIESIISAMNVDS